MPDMSSFNLSGTLNIFRVLANPSLCLPQATVSKFDQLPIPLNKAFEGKYKNVDIRAVVLDKDDCFAIPGEDKPYKPFEDHLARLRAAYPPTTSLLIVSNTTGVTTSPQSTPSSIKSLESSTQIPVLLHTTKKPGCHPSIVSHFLDNPASGVTHASQIAVIGDRLSTDVLMANQMGAYAVWVRDGVVGEGDGRKSVFARWERVVEGWVRGAGWDAPRPRSDFE